MNVINKLFLLLVVLIIPLFAGIKSCNDLTITKDIIKCENENFNYFDYIRQNNEAKIYNELPLNKKDIFINAEKLWKEWFDNLYIYLDDRVQSGEEGKIERSILLQNHLLNHIKVLQTIINKENKIDINPKKKIIDNTFVEYSYNMCQIVSKDICENIGLIESNSKNNETYLLEIFQNTPFYENPISNSRKMGIIQKGLKFDILNESLEYGNGWSKKWLKIHILSSQEIHWIQFDDIKLFENIKTSQTVILAKKTQLYKTPSEESITKMYLIAGDKADLLEEKIDEKSVKWYNILYHGKKDINA